MARGGAINMHPLSWGGGRNGNDPNKEFCSLQLWANCSLFQPGYDSGCTAVVALKVDHKVYVANAGDSRCVLCHKGGATLPLSRDHTPSVPEEAQRVFLAGGQIRAGRVDGGLNLTRAIG